MDRLKIALLGPYPASACLAPEMIRPSRRKRRAHPVPWIKLLCRGLSEQPDMDVRLFVHSRDVSSIQTACIGNTECRFVPKIEPGQLDRVFGDLTARVQLRPLVRQFNPDVVMGFGTESVYGLLASAFGKPSAIFIQGIVEKIPLESYGIPAWAHPLLRRMERRAVNRAEAVIAENEFAASWAKSVNPRIKTVVISHPVAPEFFEVRSDYKPRILFIGEINSNKRPDMVARAFFAICSRYPDAELVIIGAPGDISGRLERFIFSRGLSGRIHLIGPLDHDEVRREMSAARCLVLASRMDTSPNVITEAHAAGLPVIATRAGGVPEMVEDGTDGFLVNVDDESAMADRMGRLLEDRELAVQMGAAGKLRVWQTNSPAEIIAKYIACFRQLAVSSSREPQ